jgi:hypothetical protein
MFCFEPDPRNIKIMKKYGYNKRKVWAEEESNNIISIIQEEKGNV